MSWKLTLPLEQAELGAFVHSPPEPCAAHDSLFHEWEAPLTWKAVSSKLKIDRFLADRPALHCNFQKRTPEEVWRTNWSLWYDAALVTREEPPDDLSLTAEVAVEELTTGYGSDNQSHVAPWVGLVARQVDLRRYYYFCLEYPGQVVLYRREDAHWLPLATRPHAFEPAEFVQLRLVLRGERLEGWVNGERVCAVTDYAYGRGKAGLRATCVAICRSLTLEAAAPAARVHQRRCAREAESLAALRRKVPAVVAHTRYALPREAAIHDLKVGEFVPGAPSPQMLLPLAGEVEGATHELRDGTGRVLWRARWPRLVAYGLTPPRADGHQDVFAYGPEDIVMLDGRDGRILRRRAVAELTDGARLSRFLPRYALQLTRDGAAAQFALPEGPNGRRLWILEEDLHLRWRATCPSGLGHDDHVQSWDVDGDGREEVFAGGALWSADGEERWRNADLLRLLRVPNGGHVDAAQLGALGGPGEAPTLHLQGSSAGHLVLDARTGETIVEHAQGHAQAGAAARLFADREDLQVVSCNRWGNYGLTAVYAAGGGRLFRHQTDYKTDIPQTVNWEGTGRELILLGKDPTRIGLYDAAGHCLVDLRPWLPGPYPVNMPNAERSFTAVAGLGGDPRDHLLIRLGAHAILIGPDPATRPADRCYQPIRRGNASWPGWHQRGRDDPTPHPTGGAGGAEDLGTRS